MVMVIVIVSLRGSGHVRGLVQVEYVDPGGPIMATCGTEAAVQERAERRALAKVCSSQSSNARDMPLTEGPIGVLARVTLVRARRNAFSPMASGTMSPSSFSSRISSAPTGCEALLRQPMCTTLNRFTKAWPIQTNAEQAIAT